jgi:biopolymer transport protein ExbD
MRRPPYHRDDRGRLDVKMTPMIDVIFLLLIFFVSTASFQAPEAVLPTNLSLPGTAPDAEPIDWEMEDLEEIVVKVLWRDGRAGWRINERDLESLDDVRAVLEAAADVKRDLPVIVDVLDKDKVPVEDVIDLCDICRAIGLERVGFAASVGG